MEKYVKLKDVNDMLVKMHQESRYQHEGEDYHSGVAQVAVMLIDVPTVEFEEPKVGKWEFPIWAGQKYYKCSCCGKDYPLPLAWNEHTVKECLKYCSCCGARMSDTEKTAKWEFWGGWIGNHDMRIEDATCSNCGYKHPTVRRELIGNKFKSGETPQDILNKLSDFCPSCRTQMIKE